MMKVIFGYVFNLFGIIVYWRSNL